MKEPVWVQKEVVLALHKVHIAEFGGNVEIRDFGLLESALDRPKNTFHYSNEMPKLSHLAANYAYGIIPNHPFMDGNKRTALIVSQLFLKLNGFQLNVTASEKYQAIMSLARKELSEIRLADWIESRKIKVT